MRWCRVCAQSMAVVNVTAVVTAPKAHRILNIGFT